LITSFLGGGPLGTETEGLVLNAAGNGTVGFGVVVVVGVVVVGVVVVGVVGVEGAAVRPADGAAWMPGALELPQPARASADKARTGMARDRFVIDRPG
jgi:hypothetical protein